MNNEGHAFVYVAMAMDDKTEVSTVDGVILGNSTSVLFFCAISQEFTILRYILYAVEVCTYFCKKTTRLCYL